MEGLLDEARKEALDREKNKLVYHLLLLGESRFGPNSRGYKRRPQECDDANEEFNMFTITHVAMPVLPISLGGVEKELIRISSGFGRKFSFTPVEKLFLERDYDRIENCLPDNYLTDSYLLDIHPITSYALAG
jgi:hypothetical protein